MSQVDAEASRAVSHDSFRDDLDRLSRSASLRRLEPVEVRGRLVLGPDGALINLSGNDYLALAQDTRLADAIADAARRDGAGSGASALVSGHRPCHRRLQERFARFKRAEAALLCPTGYLANLATLGGLARPDDLICMDKLNHASLIDAARTTGATVRFYPHRGLAKAERLLERHRHGAPASARRLIVTDGVFSMDGDSAPLRELCALADRYDALLIVDDAHGTGVLGPDGAGLCAELAMSERVDVVVSTASKALGSLGGLITARREIIESIVNHGRGYIYTTGAMPVQAAAIDAALDIVRDEPDRRDRLHDLSLRLRRGLPDVAAPISLTDPTTPIVPIVVGDAADALELSGHLKARGFFAPAIRPPTVAPGTARVRISLRCDLADEDVDGLIDAVKEWFKP